MRPRPLGLVLLIAKEKLGMGGKNKGNLNPAHASSFGRCQNCRRDKPARERHFAKHIDLGSIRFRLQLAAIASIRWNCRRCGYRSSVDLRGRELGDGTVTASMSWRANADILG